MHLPIEIYLVQMMHGLVYGMLIFLVASGLTLVLGMLDILNITHAAFYMLGAYFAYSITLQLGNFWLGLLIAPIFVGIIGVLIERIFLRKTYKGGHLSQLLITFGLLFIFGELVRIIWGTVPLDVSVPKLLEGSIPFGGMTYPIYRLFILCFSVLIFIGITLVLSFSRIGIIIRAAVSDAEMVNALGINIPLVFLGVFGGGAFLAGVAGVISVPFISVHSNTGLEVLLDCFVVIVIGGFGSLLGAFIASLMIGLLQSFGILWIPKLAIVFPFLLMVLVLILRPTGLFGVKE